MFVFKLNDALNELGITKNKLSVESKVRSNTIIDLTKGQVSRIDFYTLQAVLDTLNEIAESQNLERRFDINDIVQYRYMSLGKFFSKQQISNSPNKNSSLESDLKILQDFLDEDDDKETKEEDS